MLLCRWQNILREEHFMSYTIVTDSSCNLPESLIDELELEVLPLVFMTDGEEYQSYLKGR